MNLSSSQQQALQSIESFLDSNNSLFLIKGYAGTDKTTILREIANRLSNKNRKVVLMAPIGSASMILSNKLKERHVQYIL